MSNKKQTAVESIIEKISNVKPTEFCSIETIKKWCNEAKDMEKDDKIDFANWCRIYDNNHPNEVNTIQQLFTKYYEQ